MKRYVNDFKGFTEDDAIPSINRNLAEMASNLKLDIYGEDIEELLEVTLE